MNRDGNGGIYGTSIFQKKQKIKFKRKLIMKNFDQSSNANLVQINHLLEKVEDMNKIHIQINDGIKNISALLSNIDSINADLNDCEYLFKLLDKEDIFRRHFEKSYAILNTFRNWVKLNKIANKDLFSSSEKIFIVLKNSKELTEVKIKLEDNLKN
tara:strand:- start:154 stop:621 length:468 start_codon:yes stop_codon:yes gene_type:complete